jgi:Nickel responsive protein SCO4226-like
MAGSERSKSYLVECYWPGVSEEVLAAAVERAREAAAELRRHGGEVDFLTAILVPADETVFCLFDGAEADVHAVSERAGVPFERVLTSLRIGVGHLNEIESGDVDSAKARIARASLPEADTRFGADTVVE